MWLAGKQWLCHGQHFFSHGSFEATLQLETLLLKVPVVVVRREIIAQALTWESSHWAFLSLGSFISI